MSIQEDRSYLSTSQQYAISKGWAQEGIFSLKLRKCRSNKVEQLIDDLNSKYMIYQYKDNKVSFSKDNWDLFHWQNCEDTTYQTLNTNKKRNCEDNNRLTQEITDYINSNSHYDDIEIYIQYNCVYNNQAIVKHVLNTDFNINKLPFYDLNILSNHLTEDDGNDFINQATIKMNDLEQKFYNIFKGKKISFNGMIGKIKNLYTKDYGKEAFGFFKGNASKTYYPIKFKNIQVFEII